MNFFSGDGVLQGLARLSIAALHATSTCIVACSSAGDLERASPLIVALVFAAVFGLVTGWKHLAITTFAPDWALWKDEGGLPWWRRIGLTALRSCVAWALLTSVTMGVLPHGGTVAFLPVTVAAMMRLIEAGRVRQRPNGSGGRAQTTPRCDSTR